MWDVTWQIHLWHTQPSNEHFGIVPVEAMYSGLPIIAVNNGGPTESVLHDQTGFLCEATPAEFARAMARLLAVRVHVCGINDLFHRVSTLTGGASTYVWLCVIFIYISHYAYLTYASARLLECASWRCKCICVVRCDVLNQSLTLRMRVGVMYIHQWLRTLFLCEFARARAPLLAVRMHEIFMYTSVAIWPWRLRTWRLRVRAHHGTIPKRSMKWYVLWHIHAYSCT